MFSRVPLLLFTSPHHTHFIYTSHTLPHMNNLVFIDFEANGFPDEDGTYRACLTYINTLLQYEFNDLFSELDHTFKTIDWTSNTEDMEIIFARIWTTYKENEIWKMDLLKKSLEKLNYIKKWNILTKYTTVNEKTTAQHYLCYQEDMNDIRKHKLTCEPFKSNNKQHRQVVLDTVFTTTILSCAVLHVQEMNNKITINQKEEGPCYYEVYKQDEHYTHSISAQRIHNLSYAYLQENGVELITMMQALHPLMKRHTKFIAHNAPADKKYLLKNIQRFINMATYKSVVYPDDEKFKKYISGLQQILEYVQGSTWVCTLTRARQKYQNKITDAIDGSKEQISEGDVLDEEELEDYTLQNLYEFITGTVMPKKHDAQMDVYACATIYFATCDNPPDTTALKALIAKIIPNQIVCTKPVDFWRYALLDKFKRYIPEDNENEEAKKWRKKVTESKQIPLESFISITSDWCWCLKYDGFYIRLTRDSTSRWQMSTRSGVQLHPPTSFLQHLPTTFPKGMEIEAELVFDSNQMCEPSDRSDAKKRIVKRTLDFAKLHISSLRSTKDLSGWNGMRLVLFAFPLKGTTFEQSFQEGSAIIQASQEQHPHISTCKYESVESTEKTIQIFESVVQMGLEGIILRKKTSVYQNTTDASTSIYKMKQKIVTIRKQEFKDIRQVRMTRDGRVRPEREYEVINFNDEDSRQTCKFTDSRDPGQTNPNGNYNKRLKWHERATSKMNVWDLNYLGIRHLCFATDLDLSFEVQPNAHPTFEAQVTQMLTETKPFIFIVETVYLFLAFHTYKPPVMEPGIHPISGKPVEKMFVGTKHVIDIGMLRLTGKTGETIKPQEYHHRKYTRSHLQVKGKQLGETRDLVTTLTQFLHHIPYDNKKFVFVVNNQHVLKIFKEMTDELMDVDEIEASRIENKNFRRTIYRLEFNDKARKQQVEVVYMRKFRRNIPIPWNPYGAAGRIPHKDLDPNSFCALLSSKLSEDDFMQDAKGQFNLYVELQKLWNFIGEDKRVRQNAAEVFRLHTIPEQFDENTIYLDLVSDMQALSSLHYKKDEKEYQTKKATRKTFYDKLNSLGSDYTCELKRLYEKLSAYSLQHDKLRRITLSDFQETFRPARAIEKSCPDDPATKTFPYRTEPGGINQWHVAWHMSYAFFKARELPAPWTVYTDPVPVQAQSGPAPPRQDARPTSRKPGASRQQPAVSRPPLPVQPPLPVPPRPVPPRPQPPTVDLTDSPPASPAQNSTSKKQETRKNPPPDVVDLTYSPPASPAQKRNASKSPVQSTPSKRQVQNTEKDVLPESDDDRQIVVDADEDPEAKDEMETNDEGGPDAEPTDSKIVTPPISQPEPSTRKDNESGPDEMEIDSGGQSPILQREPRKRPNAKDWVDQQVQKYKEKHKTAEKEQEEETESEHKKSVDVTKAEKWLEEQMKQKQSNISSLLHQLKLHATE